MFVSIIISTMGCKKQPTATITTDKTTVEAGGSVKFTSTSINADNVKWTFPSTFNPSTSTLTELNVTFNNAGTHIIKLEAFSKKDKKKDEATVTITVDNINKKFVGTFNMNENCTSGPDGPYQITIAATGANGITISNFGDYGVAVTGTVSGSNFTIPFQTVSDANGDYDIDATGSLSGSTLSCNYNIDYTDNIDPNLDFSDACSSTGSKQAINPDQIKIKVGSKKQRMISGLVKK